MAKTLANLAARMNRLADRLDEESRAAKLEVGMAVVSYLAYITPVDTSEALSNWQASTGGGVPGPIPPHFAGLAGSTRGASAAEAVQRARTVFEAAPASSPLVISNAAGHIAYLNAGSSAQHPGGFVEASLVVGRSILRKRKWFRGK